MAASAPLALHRAAQVALPRPAGIAALPAPSALGHGSTSASVRRGARPAAGGPEEGRRSAACRLLAAAAPLALAARKGFRRARGGGLLARRAQITKADEDTGPESFARKGKKIEVLSPSGRWREATVVSTGEGSCKVHYTGYDSQFDETVPFSASRLRAYGEIKRAGLENRKAGFVYEGSPGQCPGCGVTMQYLDPKKIGFTPGDKMPDSAPEMAPKQVTLRPEDEVKLLLAEEGVAEQDSVVFPTRALQVKYKVIANVYMDIRKEPSIDAELVDGESLTMNDTFEVSEIRQSPDARSYLRLADGRGWVFDWTMVNGARMQLIAPLEDVGADVRKAKMLQQRVCQRCWSLWHYNDCDEIFRPAFGTPALDEMTAEKFEEMLRATLEPIEDACVLAVVDVFDFGPSRKVLEYLADLLKNKKNVRVRIVANKIDLLPRQLNLVRLKGWVAREAQEAGLTKLKITDIYPLSCHRRSGIKAVSDLLEQANTPPEFYVVGAANAGKSSLLNRLSLRKRKGVGETAAVAADGFMVSVLPGTTIKPLSMKYQRGNTKLIDTPGLLVPGSLAERLSLEDLKEVIPQTEGASRVTLHMDENRSLFIGALARLDMVEGKPYQFTCFRSDAVKIHRTQTHKPSDAPDLCHAEASVDRIAGVSLTPPLNPRRYKDLKPWVPHRFEIEGAGWDEACCDIVFHGLGWISLTGCGRAVVEAWAPMGVDVTIRPVPLMPFEAKWTGVKYDGWPGWFKIGKRTTRGNDAGNGRLKVKGKF